MTTYKRICVQDYDIYGPAGSELHLKRGNEYITSPVENGQVMVFTQYWVRVPVSIFAGEILFTGKEAGSPDGNM